MEDRAPNGFEIRLTEVTILSEPKEPMPIPISKWKLNTSLETKLNLRPISLEMSESGQNSRFRKESLEDSEITYFHKDLQKFIPRRLVQKVPRAELIFSNWNISTDLPYLSRVHSFINR